MSFLTRAARQARRILKCFLQITVTEFQLRDQGTFLGFLWTFVNPLLTFLILYTVFGSMFTEQVPFFGAQLALGLSIWNNFSSSTSDAASIVSRRGYYGRSAPVQPSILIGGVVVAHLTCSLIEGALIIILCHTFIPLLPPVTAHLILGILLSSLIAFPVAGLIAVVSLYAGDVLMIWQIILRLGFFITPIVYPLKSIGGAGRRLVEANPLTAVIDYTRSPLGSGTASFPWHIFLAAGFAVVVICFVTARYRYQFAEG